MHWWPTSFIFFIWSSVYWHVSMIWLEIWCFALALGMWFFVCVCRGRVWNVKLSWMAMYNYWVWWWIACLARLSMSASDTFFYTSFTYFLVCKQKRNIFLCNKITLLNYNNCINKKKERNISVKCLTWGSQTESLSWSVQWWWHWELQGKLRPDLAQHCVLTMYYCCWTLYNKRILN